ncbi:capsular polysaccharide synthesis protein [Rhizobium rhizosphaerae]|uniref:capsular polysaccharide synthesis protein n=1 Tax=Xaviernesmea rhizosphaerae TaxID=1672749 RepID=UPI0009BCA3FC|nr:capsular polysaccharide synthesis protein [Xaviernesmea rhizosphaerae]
MFVFDVFLIWKKVSHSLRRSLVGKRRLHVANYSFGVEALPRRLPRIIWIYWDKPLEEAPDVVQAAVSSWRRKNPQWDVRVLTDADLARYVTLPQSGRGPRRIQWKADMIRVALLAAHGGVWVDATAFCVRPLEDWLPPLMQSGFFAFEDPYPGRCMQNWFLAAAPGNPLVTRWLAQMARYWRKDGKLLHYFWVMHMFEFVVRTDRTAAEIWARTPKLSPKGPSLLKRLITQKDLAEPIPDAVDLHAIPVLKISSSTRSDDPEFNAAIAERRDIDLAAMVARLLAR